MLTSKSVTKLVFALASLLMLVGPPSELRFLIKAHEREPDFEVYYTAASLVRSNLSPHIYDDAGTGVDPQHRLADEHTVYAARARARGIDQLRLYVYPPTLADLLVPLSFLSITPAVIAWTLANLAALLCVVFLLVRRMEIGFLGTGSMAIAAFVFAFRPALMCICSGQVTIILLLLLTAGMDLYLRGHKYIPGFMFALATAIKLTPLIVIVPLVAWRDWKSVRVFALWGAAVLGALWAINGGETLSLYFRHVLPSMSSGIVLIGNKTIGTALEVFWRGSDHGSSPVELGQAGKFLSALMLGYAAWLSQLKPKAGSQNGDRFTVMALFWLLSCCLAPVSLRYTYVLAIPALVILAKQALEGHLPALETALLVFFTLSISSFGFDWLAITYRKPILYDLAMAPPVLGAALGIVGLRRLRGGANRLW